MELRKLNTENDDNVSELINELIEIRNKASKSKKAEAKVNIHKNHRSRLKSQFLTNGIETLTDIQKLELLLFYSIPQKDTNPLAHDLIAKFGSLKSVLCADYKDLVSVKGIKDNTATHIMLVNSILNYCNKPDIGTVISGTASAVAFVEKLYYNVDVEQFYVVCLGKNNKVKLVKLVSTGTMDEVNVQIRTITQIALDAKCNRIIVSHNHPNGSSTPSDEDFRFTYSLVCSCMLNSIDVIDHLVVGIGGTSSFVEDNLLPKIKERTLKTVQIPKQTEHILSELSLGYSNDNITK